MKVALVACFAIVALVFAFSSSVRADEKKADEKKGDKKEVKCDLCKAVHHLLAAQRCAGCKGHDKACEKCADHVKKIEDGAACHDCAKSGESCDACKKALKAHEKCKECAAKAWIEHHTYCCNNCAKADKVCKKCEEKRAEVAKLECPECAKAVKK